MGLGGRKYDGWKNHFNPWSKVFLPRERFEVFLSDLGIAGVIGGLCVVGHYFGFACVLKTYIIPYFVVHFWLVLITFLHHTNPSCPHYDDEEYVWLKGALSTIDRRFGILDVMFHRITDTHVLHHLFAQVMRFSCFFDQNLKLRFLIIMQKKLPKRSSRYLDLIIKLMRGTG